MDYSVFNLTIQDGVGHLCFSRPNELNTLNTAFWRELPEALAAIDRDGTVRALVISSTGKHFSAGMDLSVFSGGIMANAEPGRKHEDLRRTVLQLQDVFNALESVRMPVLAAVQGGCIGGALDLISACDSRYCTQDGFFTIEETKLGMTADLGTLQRLPKIMHPGLVREMAYTGRRLTSEEALRSGLVNAVYDDAESLLAGVMAIARDIASKSPLAVTGCKEMLNFSRDHSVADSLKYMATWQSGMFQPQTDMMEAFSAKMQKRAPDFADLCPITPPMPE
jgi:enoyl-CoA hydratase